MLKLAAPAPAMFLQQVPAFLNMSCNQSINPDLYPNFRDTVQVRPVQYCTCFFDTLIPLTKLREVTDTCTGKDRLDMVHGVFTKTCLTGTLEKLRAPSYRCKVGCGWCLGRHWQEQTGLSVWLMVSVCQVRWRDRKLLNPGTK